MAARSGDEERLRGVVFTDAKEQQRGVGMRTATQSKDEDGGVEQQRREDDNSNWPGADIVPPWRPSRSPSRRGRDLSAKAIGTEVTNVSTKRIGADFWNLAMSLMGALPGAEI
uniref:Uncharacterized protein n=1 Tax=Oryza nivara TaxID=4536 RepID=A0A0E0HT39_ORYNI